MFPHILRLIFIGLSVFSFPLHGEPWAARVVSLNGVATALGRILRPGDALKEGADVKTGDATTLKLLLADDTVVDLGPNSQFQVERMRPNNGSDRQVTLRLDLGKARTSIQKKLSPKGKFLIRTKASVLAVRGTEILMDVGTSGGEVSETITVVEGRLGLSFVGGDGPSVTLGQGRQIRFGGMLEVGGVPRIQPQVLSNPTRFIQPVRQVASMVRQFQVDSATLQHEVVVRDAGGDSTLNLAASSVTLPTRGPGRLDPGDAILDIVPNPTGASSSGGLNQVPGGLPQFPGFGPGASSGRNVTVHIIFDPN